MKMRFHFLLLIATLTVTFKSVAQTYNKIEYPFVGGSTTDYVCIKAITFRSYETRIDFVACYTGNYIFLEKAGQRNALYIRIGKRKYRLQNTYGIASTDRVTFCQPGQLLEFSAIFEPIPDKERDNFDLIEGIDGTWNFYKISISKYLSREKVPDLYAIGKRNWNKINFKEENIISPYVERQSHPYLIMTEIDKMADCTKIYFYYKNPYDSYSWVNFSKDTYLQTINGKKYNVISSVGIPLSPNQHNFNKKGEHVTFCLVFPALPNDVDCFSLCEPVSDGFTFHNVKLVTDHQSYAIRWDNMEALFMKKTPSGKSSIGTTKKKLKKDPNFKID